MTPFKMRRSFSEDSLAIFATYEDRKNDWLKVIHQISLYLYNHQSILQNSVMPILIHHSINDGDNILHRCTIIAIDPNGSDLECNSLTIKDNEIDEALEQCWGIESRDGLEQIVID